MADFEKFLISPDFLLDLEKSQNLKELAEKLQQLWTKSLGVLGGGGVLDRIGLRSAAKSSFYFLIGRTITNSELSEAPTL